MKSLSGIAVVSFIISLFSPHAPSEILNRIISRPGLQAEVSNSEAAISTEGKEFIESALGLSGDYWATEFHKRGFSYEKPDLKVFEDQVDDACGLVEPVEDPHFFCPQEKRIYYDIRFMEDLFGDIRDNFAAAFPGFHEEAHNVQEQPPFQSFWLHIPLLKELQADCFAGVIVYHFKLDGYLEDEDLEEIIDFISLIGDDHVQYSSESNHGSSAMRINVFTKGFESGELSQCEIPDLLEDVGESTGYTDLFFEALVNW